MLPLHVFTGVCYTYIAIRLIPTFPHHFQHYTGSVQSKVSNAHCVVVLSHRIQMNKISFNSVLVKETFFSLPITNNNQYFYSTKSLLIIFVSVFFFFTNSRYSLKSPPNQAVKNFKNPENREKGNLRKNPSPFEDEMCN